MPHEIVKRWRVNSIKKAKKGVQKKMIEKRSLIIIFVRDGRGVDTRRVRRPCHTAGIDVGHIEEPNKTGRESRNTKTKMKPQIRGL